MNYILHVASIFLPLCPFSLNWEERINETHLSDDPKSYLEALLHYRNVHIIIPFWWYGKTYILVIYLDTFRFLARSWWLGSICITLAIFLTYDRKNMTTKKYTTTQPHDNSFFDKKYFLWFKNMSHHVNVFRGYKYVIPHVVIWYKQFKTLDA